MTFKHCIVIKIFNDFAREKKENEFDSMHGEREGLLFIGVMDKHVCFFYIQPSPKQGTILDLINVGIF